MRVTPSRLALVYDPSYPSRCAVVNGDLVHNSRAHVSKQLWMAIDAVRRDDEEEN